MPALAGLRLGQPDRADLRVGERHSRNGVVVGHVADVLAEDHVAGDARLVLAHVGEQGAAVAVADGVQPVAVDARSRAAGRRPRRSLPGLEADGVEAEVGGRRAAADGDEDLVGLELAAVGQRGVTAPSLPSPRVTAVIAAPVMHGDALGLERRRATLAGERLLAAEQPVAAFDDRHLLAPEPLEGLGHLGADGAAAEHEQPPRETPWPR